MRLCDDTHGQKYDRVDGLPNKFENRPPCMKVFKILTTCFPTNVHIFVWQFLWTNVWWYRLALTLYLRCELRKRHTSVYFLWTKLCQRICISGLQHGISIANFKDSITIKTETHDKYHFGNNLTLTFIRRIQKVLLEEYKR